MRIVFTLFGILLGAASLASLTQRAFEVGLAPISAEVLSYYRWFAEFVIQKYLIDSWTLHLFNFKVPVWVVDWFIVYTIMAVSNVRGGHLSWSGYGPFGLDYFEMSRSTMRRNTIFLFQMIVLAPVEYVKSAFLNTKLLIQSFDWRHRHLTPTHEVPIEYIRKQNVDFERLLRLGPLQSYLRGIQLRAVIFFAFFGPLIGCAAFFFWNSIQLSPG